MTEPTPRGLWADSEAWSFNAALGISRDAERAALAQSGLFDAAWYLNANPDIAAAGHPADEHFLTDGWREGRRPNPYFDPAWYLAQNPDVARAGANPLLHYLIVGERAGRPPCGHFDLAWYATQHAPTPGATLLAHFLCHRHTGRVTPLLEFDPAFYLATYPDVAAAGIDPFEHFLHYGFREGRDPSADFDTRFYLHRYLDGDTTENPLLHYRAHRAHLRLHTSPPPDDRTVFSDIQLFSRPGPDFEAAQPLPRSAIRHAKLLAYYLPQFHAIPENDAWWGAGFTEWTTVARGVPRFAGHYQPRTPRDLGHYTLGASEDGRGVMRRQIALARDAGLFGFVHYYYWFNGRRLLDAPLEAMRADPSLDFPYCLMWANENWTRRWDGSEHEVLIAQSYDQADDAALIDDVARHFQDPRYIRCAGRPVLMIYRADAIPHPAATLARWRALFAARHGEQPILIMSQSFGALDPTEYGFDAAIEFPPHKLADGIPRRNMEHRPYDPALSAHIYAYDDVMTASLTAPAADFPLIKTAVPSWDNDARRQGAGLVLHGSTPAKYQAWLAALTAHAATHRTFGEPLVAINAWNEWAEGAYLEPDVHFGAAYLNATARAVTRAAPATTRLLLVGHDAFPAGSQHLLLHLLRHLRANHGLDVEYLLLGDGALAAAYAETSPGGIPPDPTRNLAGRGFTAALVNTAAAAWMVPHLKAAGIPTTLLIHELPGIIAEKNLLASAQAGAAAADHLVFPATVVHDRFAALIPFPTDRARILPQGAYRMPAYSRAARAALRCRLGAGSRTLVLGAGYADLRKGFDLFLQSWRAARRDRESVLFCWIGDIDPALRAVLAPEIDAAEAAGSFRFMGFQRDVAAWFSAADVFALTSREDPFPAVVLEALAAGLPTVAFAGSGGIPEFLARHQCGTAVPMADVDALSQAALSLARRPQRRRLGAIARAQCAFPAYAAALLRLALPALPAISVAVLSYNYAGYLERRLASVFAQSHPVSEVLVLDDASTDDSIDVARNTAADWKRDIAIHHNRTNSGAVLQQWRRAASLASGDYLWIAEADDSADPALLATLAARLSAAPNVVLAFSDSRAIDEHGGEIWPSYQEYYRQSGADALANDALFAARDFARQFLSERNLVLNASAVLWHRGALLAALDRCGDERDTWHAAGDWRLLVELLADSDGVVAYVAAPLNAHRRHAASVTHRDLGPAHVMEITRMHAIARARLGLDAALIRRQAAYRAEMTSRLTGARAA